MHPATCAFITMITHVVIYFDWIPHMLSCCQVCSLEHQMWLNLQLKIAPNTCTISSSFFRKLVSLYKKSNWCTFFEPFYKEIWDVRERGGKSETIERQTTTLLVLVFWWDWNWGNCNPVTLVFLVYLLCVLPTVWLIWLTSLACPLID